MAEFHGRGWLEREDTTRHDRMGFEEPWQQPTICECGEVDCINHHEEAPSLAERLMEDNKRMGAVLAAARQVLDAWDVSEDVPRRLSIQLSDLSDVLARYDRIPF